jgi:hypothetical protein
MSKEVSKGREIPKAAALLLSRPKPNFPQNLEKLDDFLQYLTNSNTFPMVKSLTFI